MEPLLIVLLVVALICFGLGFAVKVLFYVAVAALILALLQFIFGAGRRRW